MRAIVKKTGEIVNITSYKEGNLKYYIHGVNSQGIEFGGEGDNFNEDFEFIEETQDKHWQDVRERAAIAALQGLLANSYSFYSSGTMKEGIVSEAYYQGHALAGRLEEAQKEKQKERIGAKKVDFAKEFDDFTKELRISDEFIFFSDIEKTARFFFQLGLKAQK